MTSITFTAIPLTVSIEESDKHYITAFVKNVDAKELSFSFIKIMRLTRKLGVEIAVFLENKNCINKGRQANWAMYFEEKHKISNLFGSLTLNRSQIGVLFSLLTRTCRCCASAL